MNFAKATAASSSGRSMTNVFERLFCGFEDFESGIYASRFRTGQLRSPASNYATEDRNSLYRAFKRFKNDRDQQGNPNGDNGEKYFAHLGQYPESDYVQK
jgi:hypothetical protein